MFQFTRPRGARPEKWLKDAGIEGFNSRAREGRDPLKRLRQRPAYRFNSRAREGRDTATSWFPTESTSFNSRAREGRDFIDKFTNALPDWFQFTRPRGARRRGCRATRGPSSFNSRAREGRDPHAPLKTCIYGEFQFTRPRGARPHRLYRPCRTQAVSIHAPARGATVGRTGRRGVRQSFNSRAREGRDCAVMFFVCSFFSFNSRAREGRDALGGFTTQIPDMFQFTRPRGARLILYCKQYDNDMFQFTRPRGARQRDG